MNAWGWPALSGADPSVSARPQRCSVNDAEQKGQMNPDYLCLSGSIRGAWPAGSPRAALPPAADSVLSLFSRTLMPAAFGLGAGRLEPPGG